MDCAACATKIRGAVERLPGVSEVSVSVMSETLSLRRREDGVAPERIEAVVRGLGYSLRPRGAGPVSAKTGGACAGDHHDHGHDHGPAPEAGVGTPPAGEAETSWYATGKGRLVLGTGALLVAAWGVKLVTSPEVAVWAFTLACLIGLFPVARRALAALRSGMPFTIEMLMTIAATGALFIGAAEEAALVVFLFAVGEVLEGVAADRARASIKALSDLVPRGALLEEADGTTRKVDAAALRIGQTVLVRPGERIPADGEILSGTSGIDESPVTGESMPKTREPGDMVFAGSINTEAALRVRVDRAPEDNTIARIIRLVEEAQESRAPTERFIDRFSRIYMPVIVALAVLVSILPPLLTGADWGIWVYRGLALLLIGCPCALVISVPASIASALSTGARRGLLLKGGTVIEAAATTRVVAFDKTGTLTLGQPVVTDVVALTGTSAEVLAAAAGVETGSTHPLAEAVLARAAAEGIAPVSGVEPRAVPGRGVSAELGGERIHVGSPRFAAEMGAMGPEAEARVAALEGEGKTVAVVFREGEPLGLLALRDEPRADAVEAVAQLRALGVRAVMLTGDNARAAAAIAGGLGMEHRAGLLPDDKVTEIREMAGREAVMMVGDGINDAPALAAASLGVAMGSGTDVALETADAALLRNRLTDVAAMIRLARAAMGNIRQNITIALGLKAVFLITTVMGLTGLWIAIMADTGATVLVTLNALRLLRFDPDRRTPPAG